MKIAAILLPVLVIVIAILAGCTGQPSAVPAATVSPVPETSSPAAVTTALPSPAAIPADLLGNWTLTRIAVQNGTAVETVVTPVSLRVDPDGSLYGYDGCNNYFGTVSLTGTATMHGSGISIGSIGSTKKYCADTADIEQQYYPILKKINAYDADPGQLTLTAWDGDVLIYQRPSTLVTPAPKY